MPGNEPRPAGLSRQCRGVIAVKNRPLGELFARGAARQPDKAGFGRTQARCSAVSCPLPSVSLPACRQPWAGPRMRSR